MSFVPDQVPELSNNLIDDSHMPVMAKAQSQKYSCAGRRRLKFNLKLGTRYGSQIGSFFEEKPTAELIAAAAEELII